MVKVVKREKEVIKERSAIEIVEDSLEVDANGAVSFRSRAGRGSGAGVEIPCEQFSRFMELMEMAQSKQQEQLTTGEPE